MLCLGVRNSIIKHLLHGWSRSQLRNPLFHKRIIVNIELFLENDQLDNVLPRDKCDIRIRKLVAHKPWAVGARELFLLLGEPTLEDGSHTTDFFVVPLFCAGELLRVELGEPGCLTTSFLSISHLLSCTGIYLLVRTLSRDLEIEPLLRVEVLWCSWREAELVLLVICLDKILDDCA